MGCMVHTVHYTVYTQFVANSPVMCVKQLAEWLPIRFFRQVSPGVPEVLHQESATLRVASSLKSNFLLF